MGRRNFFILKTFHRIIVSTIIKADADRPMKSQKNRTALLQSGLYLWCRRRDLNPHGVATNGF